MYCVEMLSTEDSCANIVFKNKDDLKLDMLMWYLAEMFLYQHCLRVCVKGLSSMCAIFKMSIYFHWVY